MAEIVDLPYNGNSTATPSQLLTKMLALAQKGEIEGVAIVVVHADKDVGVYATGTDSKYKMIGALAQLQHDILAS